MTPRSITLAGVCFGCAVVIGVAILVFAWRMTTLGGVCLLVVGFLIVQTVRRRNWARWALVLITAASLIVNASLGLLQFQIGYGGVVSAGTMMQIVLELAGCVLLFTRQARAWYAAPPNSEPR